MSLRVGVDIGGTFTDLVVLDDATGVMKTAKVLTTPQALTEAVLACAEQAGVDLKNTSVVVHGTTVGVNALIERKGAKTALLTTGGFRDVLEIGRGNFQRIYDLLYERPPILVPRHLRLEAAERLSSTGEVLLPLDIEALQPVAEILRNEGVESLAIVFLFSYRNPSHERQAAEALQQALPNLSITVSHQISQEWREYERSNTTVVNAYIQPIMQRYLGEMLNGLRDRGFEGSFLITESNGGVFSSDAALMKPVHTLESGPAAGAIGCAAISKDAKEDRLISFDMGGTTAKCCVVQDGQPKIADECRVDGQALRIPVVDITEVSAGGGSIARIDAGGALTLGPDSAGANPGPACYGLGGEEATVTDANLVAGRLNPDAMLGGRMKLRADLAHAAIRRNVAAPLDLSPVEAAVGIIRLAEVKMGLALRTVTTERGLDPRDYTLVAYGGGGPLHAVQIARELGAKKVIIPRTPSTFSAWGMLAADLRYDLVRTVLQPLTQTDPQWAQQAYEEMAGELLRVFPSSTTPELRRAVELRYEGQVFTTVTYLDDLSEWTNLRERFDAAHSQVYGYDAPNVPVELLNLRVTASVQMPKPKLGRLPSSMAKPEPVAHRDIYSSTKGMMMNAAIFNRDALLAGQTIHGPAAIEEDATTTFIDDGDVLSVDEFGFLRISVQRATYKTEVAS